MIDGGLVGGTVDAHAKTVSRYRALWPLWATHLLFCVLDPISPVAIMSEKERQQYLYADVFTNLRPALFSRSARLQMMSRVVCTSAPAGCLPTGAAGCAGSSGGERSYVGVNVPSPPLSGLL